MRQFTGQDQQRINGGIHHQKSEQRSQPGRSFVCFCQSDSNPNREQYRKVSKDNRARAAHNGKDGLKPANV